MAAGDVGPGAPYVGPANLVIPGAPRNPGDPNSPADPATTEQSSDDAFARPVVFANSFTLSPYAETGAPGGNIKNPPRNLWHASPGSSGPST
jgi:hypothetical protein